MLPLASLTGVTLIPRTELRPTTDKIKQALFSMLEAEALRRGFEADEDRFAAAHAWPRVLDLYTGTGALGIEALRRGAKRATFVEHDRDCRGNDPAKPGEDGSSSGCGGSPSRRWDRSVDTRRTL